MIDGTINGAINGTPEPTEEASPRKYRWHYRPVGTKKRDPCPVCGLLGWYGGQHRATAPEEHNRLRYLRKVETPTGPVIETATHKTALPRVRKPHPGPGAKHHSGPTSAVREKLVKAASLWAQGKTFVEIAAALKV